MRAPVVTAYNIPSVGRMSMPTMFSPVWRPVMATAVVVPGDDRLKLKSRLELVTAKASLGDWPDGGGGLLPPPPPPPQAVTITETNRYPAMCCAFRCLCMLSSAVLGIAY